MSNEKKTYDNQQGHAPLAGAGGSCFDKVKFVNDINAACEQFRKAAQSYIESPQYKRMIESFRRLGAFRD
jgi:hypothetical protein